MARFKPYRRTTTITFHHCRRMTALLSPRTRGGMYLIAERFIKLLQHAGFSVTESENHHVNLGIASASRAYVMRFDLSFHRFWERDEKFGYTMGAILAGSGASIHTYPEDEFGRCFELELNLCYLRPKMAKKHRQAVKQVVKLFKIWLQPELEPEIEKSKKRRFRPTK